MYITLEGNDTRNYEYSFVCVGGGGGGGGEDGGGADSFISNCIEKVLNTDFCGVVASPLNGLGFESHR